MERYIFIIGVACLVFAVILLIHRLRFLSGATYLTGTVVGYRYMNYSIEDQGKSKHLEIVYKTPKGEKKKMVLDNSLLAYLHKEGAPIKLAEKNKKVLVAEWLNIITAPTGFAIIGLICISVRFF